jgi:hypothetical protein
MGNLTNLINAIPDAQDGYIITAYSHNTLKAALVAIASQLGAAAPPAAQTVARTVQPNLLTTLPGGAAWTVSLGLASSGANGGNGYVSLDLPNGAVIQQLVVIGAQTAATAAKGFASLLVLPLAGTAGQTLIQIDLSTGGNPFTLSGTPNAQLSAPPLSASALLNFQTVQNSQFKYALQAQVLGAGVNINAFQVVYTTGGGSAPAPPQNVVASST